MNSVWKFGTLLGLRQGAPKAAPAAVASKPISPPPVLKASMFSPKANSSSSSTPSVSPGFLANVISFFFYLSLIAMFIFLILVFVHFTITPIFKFDINDKGLLNITPGTDGEVVWQNTFADADAKATFKNQLSCNYSVSMDIFMKNQLNNSTAPRVLLYRGTESVELPADLEASELLATYSETNLLVYIDSNKNDLNVVAVTQDGLSTLTPEAIPPLANIPVDAPFRLTILFQPGYMEVYVNGELQATRVFVGRPREAAGNFYGPPEFVREVARVANLQYWPRILAPSEVRSITPVLPAADFFVKKV